MKQPGDKLASAMEYMPGKGVYEDDGENKLNNNFSSLSTVSIMNNYVEKGYEVTNVFEEKVFSEKIEKTIRTIWFKK